MEFLRVPEIIDRATGTTRRAPSIQHKQSTQILYEFSLKISDDEELSSESL